MAYLLQLVRFSAVGIFVNLGLFLFNLGLLSVGWAPWQAIAGLYPVGVLISFLINRSWTFEARPVGLRQLARYAWIYGVAFFVSIGVAWGLEEVGLEDWVASLLTIGAVGLGLFVAVRLLVFNEPRSEP